ncbi:MAG TPA: caspase family protein [Methylomirabilota bacterium]|nr:caspase family protein [Methylomirabilota bacterium]
MGSGLALAQAPVRPSETRAALVIGNARYTAAAPRPHALNDARAMARALADAGFAVRTVENADATELRRAVGDFAGRVRNVSLAILYYSGHAVGRAGKNYLVPVDSTPTAPPGELVGFEELEILIERAGNTFNLLILEGGSRLAFMDPTSGSFRWIAFAAAPGAEAGDDGQHGHYTRALVAQLATPGLRIEDVFTRARRAVFTVTGGRQVPWDASAIDGDFVFVPAR